MSKGENIQDEPGIYVWKAPIGWHFRVVFQFAATVRMWRLTKGAALRAAEQIVRVEG